jgi:KDO2-lipid IV(A) lauroyltransferase
MKNIDKDGALKDAIRALKRAECVAVLCDQNAGARHPKVPFFGRPAHTFSTPIALALQTDSEVIPVTCVRQGLGHFYCQVHEPVPLVREGRREELLLENMKRMNRTIESIIRQHPEQWLWMHNRWRIKS